MDYALSDSRLDILTAPTGQME
jgi:hypothetical protein